jgi:hypothetical protein
MKTTMKMWMGAAAAVLMATGCGGSSAEDACEQLESSFKKADTKLSACLGGISFASLYDEAACIEGAEECSDKDLDNSIAQFDCMVDAMSCSAMAADPEAVQAKLDACETKYPVGTSCGDVDVDLNSNAALRQAKSLMRNR